MQTWRLPPAAGGAELGEGAPAPDLTVVLPARELELPALPDRPGYTVYVPEGPNVPRRAVVVLHGMGGNGPGMAGFVLPFAQRHGLVVIAPTIAYGEWRDPAVLAGEILRLQPQLRTLIDGVTAETGVPIAGRALLFGFSRGAQAALRFAMLYPDRVEAVVALSAGTYTLPVRTVAATDTPLAAPLPYGVSDLEQRTGRAVDALRLTTVRFWIGVGALDNREGDVPRQWDPFIGNTRVERATNFASLLASLGCDAQVSVIPSAGHEITGPMVEGATDFFAAAMRPAEDTAAAPPAAWHDLDPAALS